MAKPSCPINEGMWKSLSTICTSDWYMFLGGVGVSLVSFITYKVIEYFRVTREEFNADIDKAVELLSDVCTSANLYWTEDQARLHNAILIEQKIKTDYLRFNRTINNLVKLNRCPVGFERKCIIFFQTVTGGDFESNRRVKDHSKIPSITHHMLDMEGDLLAVKKRKTLLN